MEITPVGDDIVLVALRSDVRLDGKDDLVVLGIGQAGQDGRKVDLAALAGVKREIRTEHPGEPGLEGVAGCGKGGDMELVFFLLDGIDPSCVVALQEGAAQIYQIELVMKGILCGRVEDRQGQEGYEQVC